MADEQLQDQNAGDEDSGAEFETSAREMGWVPKEEWKDDQNRWVDAKTFVERGEQILPILQANNRRLKKDLLTRDRELDSLKQSLEAAQKSIRALQKQYTETTQREVEKAKAELREQLINAREAGDTRAEFAIQDKLQDLTAAQTQAKEDHEDGQAGTQGTKQPEFHPDFVAWQKENSWFGDTSNPENKKRTKAIIRIGEDLREDGDTTTGIAFMNKCLAELEKQEGKATQSQQTRTNSKVESGTPGARSGGGRDFDKLPKEAKDICHADSERFVGPGKMFKTEKEWEDHYAKLYNEG